MIKILAASFVLAFASISEVYSQFAAGDGVFIVVAFAPEGCKEKLDGHYIVSDDGTVSFPFMDERVKFDRDIEDIRNEMKRVIGNYSRNNFPGISVPKHRYNF